MIPVLLTGAKGQLGSEIGKISRDYKDLDILKTDLEELDIRNENEINRTLDAHRARYIINCAAYTSVDKAEEEKEKAFMVNASVPEMLAE